MQEGGKPKVQECQVTRGFYLVSVVLSSSHPFHLQTRLSTHTTDLEGTQAIGGTGDRQRTFNFVEGVV